MMGIKVFKKSIIFKAVIANIYALIILGTSMMNIFSFSSSTYNSYFLIQPLGSNEILIKSNRDEALFVVSPYQLLYRKEQIEDVIFDPQKTIFIIDQEASVPSYNSIPKSLTETIAGDDSDLKIDIYTTKYTNKIFIDQELNMPNQSADYYLSGINISADLKVEEIEDINEHAIFIKKSDTGYGYKITSSGSYLEYRESLKILFFIFNGTKIEYSIEKAYQT